MLDPKELLPIFLMVSAMTILAVAGLYTAAAVRRWTQRERSTETFSLDDLRTMRASGEITEAEFKAMRATLLSQMAATLGDIPAPRGDASDESVDDSPNHATDD